MSKLITAKEAAALSNSEINIDEHIDYINQQIEYACQNHENHVNCNLRDCTYHTAVAIAAQLRIAGYCFKWHFDSGIYIEISWEGIQ